jgi:SAM-dependent methyltransferase
MNLRGEVISQNWIKSLESGKFGGCAEGGDPATYTPNLWEFLVDTYKVSTVLDIGCGMGYASSYFKSLGCSVVGVDGLDELVEKNLIKDEFILHDYEQGCAINGDDTFDLAWCCEFVEHVYEEYSDNFLKDFQRCNHVAITYAYPGQGGHHHVNENTQEYWISRMEKCGFDFKEDETNILKKISYIDALEFNPTYKDNHFNLRGLFFSKK